MPVYIDINTDFGQNTAPVLLTDMDCVQNKIMNLFRCLKGTRFRQPEFGVRLQLFIHEPCDGLTADDIRIDLIEAIRTWVPEVTVMLDQSVVVPMDNGAGYYVRMAYYVPRLQLTGSMAFAATR